MPLYVILSKLTDKGAQTIFKKPERILEVNKELEDMGLKVLQQYLVFGEWDFLNIVEAKDDQSLAAALINLNMRGTIRTATYKLMPVNELIEAVKKAAEKRGE
ncbi:GYD domain-containing protein [Pyrofollis japonicus]|uniref:GYD domain-containing protein n=1 Tax=Pyrofollis japonicus TaxID=3060460 RepID=UPI00295BD423|nr:GYD domain-containing protein [Pyrofollis japonicus]BEP17869.1 GYD domain-containing protein [Pyrofollis japonicus]